MVASFRSRRTKSLFDAFFLIDTVPRPLAVLVACQALALDRAQIASTGASETATASEVARLLLYMRLWRDSRSQTITAATPGGAEAVRGVAQFQLGLGLKHRVRCLT